MPARRPPDPFAPFEWRVAHGRQIELGARSVIMGVVNVTPDSFSDGGLFVDTARAVEQAHRLVQEGAAIIDIGGESTRPGAADTDAAEEQARVLPVIEALASADGTLISIDTWRADTARRAIEAGAHIVNDIKGLRGDTLLAGVIAEHRAGCIIMHNGRGSEALSDVVADQRRLLEEGLSIAARAGIEREAIILDPGFGFAKDAGYNLELLARIGELTELDAPLLIGTSRKRFIGHATGREAGERDIGTAATSVVARLKGGAIFRVHDARANKDALAIADAVIEAERSSGEAKA